MMYTLLHTRGILNMANQAYGIPYSSGQSFDPNDFIVGPTKANVYNEVNKLFADLLNGFNTLQPVLNRSSDLDIFVLSCSLLLDSGWYIEDIGDFGIIDFLFDEYGDVHPYFKAVFPQISDFSFNEVRNWILETFVKKPYDIVGLSPDEYGQIYGMDKNSYAEYFGSTGIYMFKVDNSTSPYYVSNLPNGNIPSIMHVWDSNAIRDISTVAFFGESILLQWLVDAGLPLQIGDITIVPSNPHTAYVAKFRAEPEVFTADSPSRYFQHSFDLVLSQLGIMPDTLGRYLSLYYTYEAAGTKYSYGGGSYMVADDNYGLHSSSFYTNRQKEELRTWHYQDLSGNPYVSGMGNENLLFYGHRLYDCGQLAMAGPAYGQTVGEGIRSRMLWADVAGGIKYAAARNESRVVELDGSVFTVQLYAASDDHYTLKQYRDNPGLVAGGLKPGDIMVRPGDGSGNGHVFTILGVSNSSFVLSAGLARNDLPVVISAGDLVVIEAAQTGTYNSVRIKSWDNSDAWWIVRTNVMDN